VELGETKLVYDEYDNISDFYKNDFQKFVEYNIHDVTLVEKLEAKLKLIELAVALAYNAGVNFSDVFSQVKTWDVIIYNYLLKNKIVVPPKKHSSKDEQFAGAYVKDPIVGMHDWVVSFDLNSLYPHLIMQYNISTETITKDGKFKITPMGILNNEKETLDVIAMHRKKDLSVAANGTTYIKTKRGFLPDLMDNMYKDRKMFKGKMIDAQKELELVNAELKRRQSV
jgi:DNA polymerase elongation subunit (family B)